jgi:hypothetical protein
MRAKPLLTCMTIKDPMRASFVQQVDLLSAEELCA